MSKNNGGSKEFIIFSVVAILLLVGIFSIFKLDVFNSKKDSLEVYILDSGSEMTGCKTIFADTSVSVFEYSFDNGSTWTKSNHEVVCTNGVRKVLARNNSNEIVASGSVKIENLSENSPKIEIDFDTEVDILNESSLLNGVKVTDNSGKNITDNVIVETKLSDDNEYVILKYSAIDELGNKTVVERNVSLSNNYLGTSSISYERPSYSCKPGETITTKISVSNHSLTSDDNSLLPDSVTVKSYKSNNTSVANIKKHPTLSSKDPGTEIVLISCLKTGDVVLSATSSVGLTTTSNVSVSNEIKTGKLMFEKNSYDVSYGKTISITLYGANKNDLNLNVKNSDIITVDKLKFSSENVDVATLNVEGLKVGTTSIEVSTKNGEKASVTIVVKDCNMEFGSNNYQLTTGSRLMGTVKSNYSDGDLCIVKTVKSSNNNIVSILYGDEDSEKIIASNGGFRFYMNPIKEGKVTLTATCETGKKITSTVTVKNKKITKFTSSNYELDVGDDLYITVASFLENGTKDEIVKIQAASSGIVSVKENGYNTKYSRYGFTLTGLKSGITIITATTKSGATASAKVVVSKKETGSISFDKTNYTCSAGQKITAQITAGHSKESAKVESYKSSNTSVATIIKHPSLTSKSSNVTFVQINCIKNGEVTLSATSNFGAQTTAKVKISDSISFQKSSYSVDVGKSVQVKLYGANQEGVTITAENSAIVEVGQLVYSRSNPNEGTVTIKGLKEGTTKLVLKDKYGNKAISSVIVSDCTMAFGTSNYNAIVGLKIYATLSSKYSNGNLCKVSKITSSNANVATVTFSDSSINSAGKYYFYINPKSLGTTVLTATCESGKKITSKVTVSNVVGFEKSSYSIKEGETIQIKLYGVNREGVKVTSENDTVAKLDGFISYSKTNPIEGTISVTGFKVGTSKLTLIDKDGNKAYTTITVK